MKVNRIPSGVHTCIFIRKEGRPMYETSACDSKHVRWMIHVKDQYIQCMLIRRLEITIRKA